jgi:uncharacterized membrane protein YdjX (TVP38/TMEM64 family)
MQSLCYDTDVVEGKTMEKSKPLAVNIVLVTLFVGTLVYLTIRYGPELTRLVNNPQQFREYLLSFGPWSSVVFMLFQMIQVVIAIIPGEPLQIAGGYMFGTFLGTFYSIIGITVGYIIVFFIVKLFGYPLVKKLVAEKELEKFRFIINSPKLEATIFLLFLIPGIPKDILVYIAGLTPLNPITFFLIITIARTPALIGSAYIGAKIETNEYKTAVIVSIIASILFVFGIIYKDKIIDLLNKSFHRGKKENL